MASLTAYSGVIMIEILRFEFFQNALLVSVLASVVCGIMGSIIVVKRMSYLTSSISHTAFGGIGLAILLGFNPIVGAMVIAILGALAMGHIKQHFKQFEDTLIGILWSIGMAIGVLAIHFTKGYAVDINSYLFGNILLTSRMDSVWLLGMVVVLGICLKLWYRHFLAITFDENYAITLNISTQFFYALLLVLTAISTILLVKVVGIILVIALITFPAATALNLTQSLPKVMGLASLLCAISTVGGLFISYVFNVPTSPITIFLGAGLYGLSLAFSKTR